MLKYFLLNKLFFSARKYYDNNILIFGDSLHQIHPLAGQGFNMTLRDLKVLSSLIKRNISLGLPVDQFVLNEFEKSVKSKNTLFSFGIDAIHNFFKIKKNLKNDKLDNFIKFIGNNVNLLFQAKFVSLPKKTEKPLIKYLMYLLNHFFLNQTNLPCNLAFQINFSNLKKFCLNLY